MKLWHQLTRSRRVDFRLFSTVWRLGYYKTKTSCQICEPIFCFSKSKRDQWPTCWLTYTIRYFPMAADPTKPRTRLKAIDLKPLWLILPNLCIGFNLIPIPYVLLFVMFYINVLCHYNVFSWFTWIPFSSVLHIVNGNSCQNKTLFW